MNREYHKWHSPNLHRNMDMLVFGHAGAKVLVFPTSKGKFYEWEDRKMMQLLSDPIERGWLQIFCVDSVDAESWYNWQVHPGQRAYRQVQYDDYLYHEVLPFMASKNPNPFHITVGASFGAYHAMNFGLKHPDKVGRILAFSGIFDIRGWTDSYSDTNTYLNNPVEFVHGEHDPNRLGLLQKLDIVIATGREDRLIGSARTMSSALWNKGIGNALREWDGWSHDWPYWERMILLYINGHD